MNKKYSCLPKPERNKYVELWKQSGLSVTTFCKEHGIRRQTFYSLRASQHQQDKKIIEQKPFVALESRVSQEYPQQFFIEFPSGIKVALNSIEDAVLLLKHLHKEAN